MPDTPDLNGSSCGEDYYCLPCEVGVLKLPRKKNKETGEQGI